MLYLFYGKDAYRLHQQLELIVTKYVGKEGFAVTSLDMVESESREALESAIQDRDIFGAKKVVVARSLALHRDWRELVQLFAKRQIAEDPALLVIVREDDDCAKKKEFLEAFVQQRAVIKKFTPLTAAALERWVIEYAHKSGLTLPATTARHLIAAENGDLWGISTRIDTLSVMPLHTQNIDDLFARAHITAAANAWGIAQKFFAADKPRTAHELSAFFQSGGDEGHLFNILISAVRNATSFGKISMDQAKQRMMLLEWLDILIKSSRTTPRQAIELLLVEQ